MRGLIAAVVLGGVFGSASATVDTIDEEVMVVEIEVEVLGAPGSVVAHLSFQDERTLTLPLLDRGDGSFGIRTELEPKYYFVVFEAVGDESESTQPVTLAQMGADLGTGTGGSQGEPGDEGMSPASTRWLWLSVALGAASLSALAFWVLGVRDDDADRGEDSSDEEE
jgi:hypothetical protein